MKNTVCITGTSQGIGLGLVKAFLSESDTHVLAITRNKKSVADKLDGSTQERLTILEADICEESGRTSIYETLKNLPPMSICIHNAGTLLFKPFAEIEENMLKKVYEVNVFAPFLLTQKLLPLMNQTHSIYISSVGGVQGSVKFPGLSAYSSSKSALNCLTEMLSEEYRNTNNVFNCLALGSVNTEMFQEAFPGFDAASGVEEIASYIVSFARTADKVMRGKIISLSKSNP